MFDQWLYERFSRNGGSGARGLRRTLSGSGLKEAHRLGREIPQNTGDAERGGGPVRLTFRLMRYTGAKREVLLKLLQTDGLTTRGVLTSLPDPLPILFIEDSGTLGLGGVEQADEVTDPGRRSRYVGLCMTFGDAAKDAAGGGTFGFGKSVLWNVSRAQIVLFHSRFDPEPLAGGVSSRLVGCALFDSHAHGGKRYTGRAFLGKNHADEYTRPLTGDEADKLAAQIGFVSRKTPADTGTSIAVVDSHFDTREHLEKIREGIERYYWPRIIDTRLEVKFFDGTEELDPPRPRLRNDLRPYIEAYERALAQLAGRSPAATETTWHGEIARPSVELGVLALSRVEPAATAGEEEDDEEADQLHDTVALVRTPRMVVSYHPPYQRAIDQHFAGVFVARDSINAVLAKSEPPAHNLWDENADEMTTVGSQTVRAVHDGIKKRVREFLSRQRAREIEPTEGCPAIDRELSDLLRMPEAGPGRGHSGSGSGPGSHGHRESGGGVHPADTPLHRPKLFRITFLEAPRTAEGAGGRIVEAKIRVEVENAAERKAAKSAAKAKYFQIVAHPRILVDDGQFDDTELPVAGIAVINGGVEENTPGDRLRLPLGDGRLNCECWVRTAPLEHEEQVIDLHVSGQFLNKLPEPEVAEA
jgi:hypothetical protein